MYNANEKKENVGYGCQINKVNIKLYQVIKTENISMNYEKSFDENEPFHGLGKISMVGLSCIRFVYFNLDTNYFIRNSVYRFEWHENTPLPPFCSQCINSIWIVNTDKSRKKGHSLYCESLWVQTTNRIQIDKMRTNSTF